MGLVLCMSTEQRAFKRLESKLLNLLEDYEKNPEDSIFEEIAQHLDEICALKSKTEKYGGLGEWQTIQKDGFLQQYIDNTHSKEVIMLILSKAENDEQLLQNCFLELGDRTAGTLLSFFPEKLNKWKLLRIVKKKNIAALKKFMKEDEEEKKEAWQEMILQLHDYSNDWGDSVGIRCLYKDNFLQDDKTFDEELKQEAKFYRLFLDAAPNEEAYGLILKAILGESLCRDAERYYLVQIFTEIQREDDYTKVIIACAKRKYGMHTVAGFIEDALNIGVNSQVCGIDLYDPEWNSLLGDGNNGADFEDSEWSFEDFMMIMKPLKILPQTDVITKKLLKLNQPELILKGIRYGYITSENALALYEYAVELEKTDEAILAQLIFIANDRPVQERYI